MRWNGPATSSTPASPASAPLTSSASQIVLFSEKPP